MDEAFALQARWVVPIAGPPIAGGVVTLRAGTIVAVGRQSSVGKPLHLGNVALLPGLVNPHTHLFLSDCRQPLGDPSQGFARWIAEVVAYNRALASDAHGEGPMAAVLRGLDESLAAGVTSIGDIALYSQPSAALPRPAHVTSFYELIGLRRERGEAAIAWADELAAKVEGPHANWQPGLSPHAPYTVRRELLDAAARLSMVHAWPLAFHLAESFDEMELLATGGGPLRQVLESLGAWDAMALPGGLRPIDYLQRLAQAHRVLIIHGNYLSEFDIEWLAGGERFSVIFCPRTHAWFKHPRHPLPNMLAAGVNVAVGTDSRASSPDLRLLQELRCVANWFPELDGATVMSLGTIAAARALGRDGLVGSLEPGKQADLAVVPLADDAPADAYEAIFTSPYDVSRTMVRGEWVS